MSERITAKYAAELLERISGLPNWPELPAARKALADMLASRARSQDHAIRIVASLEESSFFAPTPAAIAQAAQQVPPIAQVPLGCGDCFGSGWRSEKRKLWRSDGTRGPGKLVEVDAATRCHCARGQALKAMHGAYSATERK